MKGGKKMRKLNKVNSGRLDTIEAYACVCSCNCANACNGCGCAITSAKSNETSSLSNREYSSAYSSGRSAGYRK